MACQWRIRHKLVLGLGLVVLIVGLLLAGTLKGLLSYQATMKSIDSKLSELQAAEALKGRLGCLAPSGTPPDMAREQRQLRLQLQEARLTLDDYEQRLKGTVSRGRDPDHGFQETQLIEALREGFDRLEKAINRPIQPHAAFGPTDALLEDYWDEVRKEIAVVVRTSDDLRDAISYDLNKRIQQSKKNYLFSMWIVLSTSIVGVLLMASLLRFFYGWIFNPIRDLEAGAKRVAQGDFDHRIEVQSGDEMQDLAGAFNEMTGRLRDMYGDLARQVNERSRQLVRSERLASVGFLAAGVAHEINNPLASIAFCSEALESRLADALMTVPEQDGEVIGKYLRMIQQEAFRCKEITQRLLEFSRGGERRREPVNLGELVQSVLDMVEHLQSFKGKHIDFDAPAGVVAWVNAQEIKSVVLNLVVNALDSMDDGGTLTIRLRQRSGMAEAVFADSGCGMTPEVLENIFEPFFTRSRTGKGTGLGLTISHRIISQHGGEIEATSAGPNQGSTFTVRLPLQLTEEEKPEVRSQKSEDSHQAQGLGRRRAA